MKDEKRTSNSKVLTARFDNLTAARFFAALLVYMSHSTGDYQSFPNAFIKNFVSNGYVGVSFFFILSGFVLAASNWERLEKFTIKGTLSFYWKRIARIVPLWLIVSLPLITYGFSRNSPGIWSFVTFTQAWSSNVDVAFGFLAVAWTLSVEMFFYALFPFIAAGLRWAKGAVTGPALVGIGLIIPLAGFLYFYFQPVHAPLPVSESVSSHYFLYRYPPMRFGEFLIGIGVFLCLSRGVITLSRRSTYALGAASLFGAVLSMGMLPEGGPWWVFPSVIFFGAGVYTLAQLEILGISVQSKLIILLGESSFALYLIHQWYFKGMIMPVLVNAAGVNVGQAITLLLAICTSVGLFIVIESPSRYILLRMLHIRRSGSKVESIEVSS